MDTEATTQEEELEINLTETTTALDQRKSKSVTKILYGGVPANPKDPGLETFARDPKKYIDYDKIMIGKEIKGGNISFCLLTNTL